MNKFLALWIVVTVVSASAYAKVEGKELLYNDGVSPLKGYLAVDTALAGKRPGVLVVHEWWGHNEYARSRADRLAALGYVALAIDMYGDGKVAAHPDEAGQYASQALADLPAARTRFEAALHLLQQQASVDGAKIGAIGYCFGGGVVLHMARLGVDLRGVVSFHGSLHSTVHPSVGQVKAKILVCHGAADAFIPADVIDAFNAEMAVAKVDCRFQSYPGAVHGFTNPAADDLAKKFSIPIAYQADADRQSWDDMQRFFKEIFQ